MYSKSYEKKYIKYKNKYKILKSYIGGTLLNGGDCDPLPNPEEEDIVSRENLLDLCPEERITIQNKCYEVRGLHNWIIEENNDILPHTQTTITLEEKERLVQAYEELPKVFVPNILTRDNLIQIYPNLLQETIINLQYQKYTGIAPDTFGANLPKLNSLFLDNNEITELPSYTFNNLPKLRSLYLDNNKIQELHYDTFYNLPKLNVLNLKNNQIQELQVGIFNNLSKLRSLYLDNNKIQELHYDTFYNLQKLNILNLRNNRIQELPPGIFNNLPNLQELLLDNNYLSKLQSGIFNNLPKLVNIQLNNNRIQELQPGTFNNLPKLRHLYLENNHPRCFWQIQILQQKSYYGLSGYVNIII
jgi:Leucine-rich repeat (LRR) protein